MQEFIVSETKKIFNKAIKNFSKKDGIEQDKVSILLNLEIEGKEKQVRYRVCHNYSPVKYVSIMDVLGVKIDFKGYSILVPPQIKNILENFEQEQQSEKVEAGVFLNPEDDDDVVFFLFKEGQMVRKFELADVLKFKLEA